MDTTPPSSTISKRSIVFLILFGVTGIFLANIIIMSFHVDSRFLSNTVRKIHLRGGHHLPVALKPGAMEAPLPSSAKQPPREQARAVDVDHWTWVSSEMEYDRHRLPNGQMEWAEVQGGVVKFRFHEEVFDSEKKLAIFYDTARNMRIKIDESSAFYESMGRYTHLASGDFELVAGKRVSLFDGDDVDDANAFPPLPIITKEEFETAKVLVTLAAYRDPLCGNTLMEAFSRAKFPDRVFAAVVQQNGEGDVDCLEDYCKIVPDCRRSQVKIDTVPLSHSRGVMPARYRQHLLIADEEFCLQADAHSVFEDEWDLMAIQDWYSIQNEMAVITAYPNRASDRHKQGHTPVRCSTQFGHRREVVHGGNSAQNLRPGRAPYVIPFFGAGTAFSKCHANLNVPYDPYMSFLFGGEEFNRAVRLWTWGYDMYAPLRNFVYHYYDSDEKPPQAKGPRKRDFASSAFTHGKLSFQGVARWRTLLGLDLTPRLGKVTNAAMDQAELFGLGSRRSLADYEKFSGVDLKRGTTEDRCKRVGHMRWKPYQYDQDSFDPRCYKSSSGAGRCCTTLELVKEKAQQMLDMDNKLYQDVLDVSLDLEMKGSKTPLVSPLAQGRMVCPTA